MAAVQTVNGTPLTIQTAANVLGVVRDELAAAARAPHAREDHSAMAYINSTVNADTSSETALIATNARLQYLTDAEAGLTRMAARLTPR